MDRLTISCEVTQTWYSYKATIHQIWLWQTAFKQCCSEHTKSLAT